MKIAIVILNWNGKKFLEMFLPKVVETSRNIAGVYVADNGSTDDSLAFLENNFPSVKIIRHAMNLGFAAGYNRALNQIDADYYVLLNSDIEVTQHWIEPVIELMESDAQIAACQPKIRSYNNRHLFEYAGAAGGFIDRFGYPFCRGRIFQSIEEDHGQYDEVSEIFWASGACLFIRATCFNQAGCLDDDFFAHMEEIDLCWRLKHLGYKIMYCGNSTVYHIGGGSLDKSSPRKTYLNIRNNSTLLYKNLPKEQLIPVFLARFFLDMMASVKFLVDGGFRHFIAVSRAHFGFYFSYKKNRIKRNKIRHKHVSQIYNGNIALDHFLKGKRKFSQLDKNRFLTGESH
ncbi:MAG: glycosyltransferase family 2 protein [Bacteroidales bacterium]|nr:glycosyltransferase family 2 protein [Bacteroidales bacterium]